MNDTDAVAAGAARQAELLASGQITSRQLTEATLETIQREDARWNAVVQVLREEALTAADEADRRRAAGDAGPLTGVPIAIKDDLDVAGTITGWGSRAQTTVAASDADLVAAIRQAGMVPVATTTLPELAICGFTETAARGITRNPHDPSRTPGGSSGGSGALVASGAVGIATASDGAGSIRIPAACCGLVGFKPTHGRMPSSGGWHGLSTQGCVTPTLADSALFLDTLGSFEESLSAALDREPGSLRIGLSVSGSAATRPAHLDPQVRDALDRAAGVLAVAGHQVTELTIPYGIDTKSLTVRYLRGIRDAARSVDEPERLEPRTRSIARLGAPFGRRALDWSIRQGEQLGATVHDRLGVDVLLMPVMSGPPIPVGHWRRKGGLGLVLAMNAFYAYTAQWNHAGVPAVSVPAGTTPDGLPLAVQLVGRRGHDAELMSLAAQLEGRL